MLTSENEELKNDTLLRYMSFSLDSSSLCVGGERSFKIIDFQTAETISVSETPACDSISIVERSFSPNLVVFVRSSSPCELCIQVNQKLLCPVIFDEKILAVRSSHHRLAVILSGKIVVYHANWPHFMRTMVVVETPVPTNGIVALSSTETTCKLAYPAAENSGQVMINEAHIKQQRVFHAHESVLASLAFNSTGEMIATASERGTIIRVFRVADCLCIYEFRRGLVRCAAICALSFSLDNSYLVCSSSNTETVHVFRLDPADLKDLPESNDETTTQTWLDYIGKTSTELIPFNLKVFNHDRCFASAKLPKIMRTVCSVRMIDDCMCLLVASIDGDIFVYEIDRKNGGECCLRKTYNVKLLAGDPTKGESTGKIVIFS